MWIADFSPIVSYRCPAPPPRCVYWNETEQGWLGNGCELVSVGETNVTCKCNRTYDYPLYMYMHTDTG